MKIIITAILGLLLVTELSFGQGKSFEQIQFIVGEWQGEGRGFGNEKSKITSSFKLVMDEKFIEVINESRFEPTHDKPDGEHHLDHGFISFDQGRKCLVYRQFNNEGYINQYILNDSLSNSSLLIFETENIENFVPGGKARWTIKNLPGDQIETTFDVSFPGQEYACFGTNLLSRK